MGGGSGGEAPQASFNCSPPLISCCGGGRGGEEWVETGGGAQASFPGGQVPNRPQKGTGPQTGDWGPLLQIYPCCCKQKDSFFFVAE